MSGNFFIMIHASVSASFAADTGIVSGKRGNMHGFHQIMSLIFEGRFLKCFADPRPLDTHICLRYNITVMLSIITS